MKEYTIKTSEDILIFVVKRKTLAICYATLFLLVAFSIPEAEHVYAESKINCGAFPSRLNAQIAYNSDPIFYARLDGRDKDGKVCETYKYN